MSDVRRIMRDEASAIIRQYPGRAVVTDSRKVKKGDIFVAVSGVNVDGKAFINDAVANGAGVVVYSGDVAEKFPGVEYVEVSDSRLIVSYLFKILCGSPDEAVKLYAVSGTNGKTTSAFLLNAILQRNGVKCGLFSTVEYFDGRETLSATHTTPDAGQFFDLLARMKQNGLTAAAMESSSHALAQHRLDGANIAGAIFTNLTGDHLDYHKTMDNYFAAKVRLFTELLNSDGCAAVNIDDPYGRKLADLLGGVNQIASFGVAADAVYRIENIELFPGESRFVLKHNNEIFPVRSNLTGAYNVYNLAGVLTLLLAEGFRIETLLHALEAPFQIPGRLEEIKTASPAQFFVDFAHTDDALRNVLSTVKPFAEGRLWVIFGAGGDRDKSKRPRMGEAAAEYADVIVITSDNPRSENPEDIIADIAAGIPDNKEYLVEVDRAKALRYALANASAGDIVIVAGKGHENYQEIAGVKYHFSDRELLMNAEAK